MTPLVFGVLLAGKKADPVPPTMTVPPPTAGVYLRSGFDTDPSGFLGRFLPPVTTDLDESDGMTTRCSSFVSYKKVGGGGVKYGEQLTVASDVAARIGVPLVVGVEAGRSTAQTVRVEYTLLNKMVAEIADPAGFESCCKAAADQCTDRFISEFYEGTGIVAYARAIDTRAKVKGVVQTVAASVDVAHGVEWVQSIAFDQPVYFAFKTTPNAFSGANAAACGPWTDAPPRSTQGTYFVGTAPPAANEAVAREAALRDARTQVVQWTGTQVSSGALAVGTTTSGGPAGFSNRLTVATVLQTACDGVASLVKDESWCITPVPTPDGTMVTAKVLAFLPTTAAPSAAEAVAKAVGP